MKIGIVTAMVNCNLRSRLVMSSVNLWGNCIKVESLNTSSGNYWEKSGKVFMIQDS